MQKLGFIGARGMVGTVLLNRMLEEKDFVRFKTTFFSTSMAQKQAPQVENATLDYQDANNLEALAAMDIIISCQGGDYTKSVHPKLRALDWQGIWIDAASALRMEKNACLILDPINSVSIEQALNNGVKDFIGANCTVSLMLLALDGLFKQDLVEWVSSMTYQAASGAGAQNMLELLKQMNVIGSHASKLNNLDALSVEHEINHTTLTHPDFPKQNFGHPLALNLLPWIDSEMENGQSKEEWKAQVEANKILNTTNTIAIDGTCVRVGALRCHSQGLTIKLKKNIDLKSIETIIGTANDWVKLIPNQKEATLNQLCPKNISGSLNIGIGRLRKMSIGPDYLNAFTVGDQLLWGAAEPLRRMLAYLK